MPTSTVQKGFSQNSIDSAANRLQIEFSPDNAPNDATNTRVVLIERRVLFRDCLAWCLKSAYGFTVLDLATVEDWLSQAKTARAALVVLCLAGKSKSEEIKRDIDALAKAERPLPTIVFSDCEDTNQIVEALDRGVRGFIPTNTSLNIAVEAMRLVRAGGIFVPASSLVAAQRLADGSSDRKRPLSHIFTARQVAVVEALRMGKANKLIAYELNMCESTVKVHVRNIMKKLKARNRTQVAFMANELLHRDGA